MKKNLLNISLLFCLLLAANNLFAQTAFNGKWQINKTKTNFGEAPEWVLPKSYTVNSGKDQLTIERVTLDAELKEHPATETFPYDGKQVSSTVYSGSKRTASLKVSSDQKTLIITASSVSKDGAAGAKITDTWSLTDNGKTLVIDRTVVNADASTYTLKAFYDQQ